MPARTMVACLILCLSTAAVAEDLAVPLALADLQGRTQRLEELRGSIVVVNFWATWCLPCREEMPILNRTQRRFADEGVRVIGVSTDEAATIGEVARFARKARLKFPVWVGGTVADMQRFGLGSELPATVILDRDGVVVERIPGVVDEQDLTGLIESILADRSNPAPVVEDDHDHGEEEEEHQHGGVGMEGASLVPS